MKTCGILITALTCAIVAGCEKSGARTDRRGHHPEAASRESATEATKKVRMTHEIQKTDEEWRSQLTPEQYDVTRREGTERAFTGQYWDHKGDGVYRCVCCGETLFDSATKFDSGSGWPSFWAPIGEGHVHTQADSNLGMRRVEVECRRCGAHLGHVFEDGPKPTGMRYCVNSASLQFSDRERGEQED